MLTEPQARDIVNTTIYKMTRKSVSDQTQLGTIIAGDFADLVERLIADPSSGVSRYDHYLDPNVIGDLRGDTTVGDLTDMVMRLSAGKLCSNPNIPHPQSYPYPASCPQCGYPVI